MGVQCLQGSYLRKHKVLKGHCLTQAYIPPAITLNGNLPPVNSSHRQKYYGEFECWAISQRQTYTGNLPPAKIRLANQPDRQLTTGKHKTGKAKTINPIFPRANERPEIHSFRYSPDMQISAYINKNGTKFGCLYQRIRDGYGKFRTFWPSTQWE